MLSLTENQLNASHAVQNKNKKEEEQSLHYLVYPLFDFVLVFS